MPNNLPPIIPNDLATRLNVVQGQMARFRNEARLDSITVLSMLDWEHKLREIELRLRSIPVVKPDARETDAYFRELSAPRLNAQPTPPKTPARFGSGYWAEKLENDLLTLVPPENAIGNARGQDAENVVATLRAFIRSIITEEK